MIRRFGAGILVVLGLYLGGAALGGLVSGAVRPAADIPADTRTGDPVEIGLIFGPIHVDFLLPNDPRTQAALSMAMEAGVPLADPQARHILVGWGAREFYTTAGTFADVSWAATARAVTGDASVLRFDVVGALPPGYDYPRLTVSASAYERLLRAIVATASDEGVIPGAGLTQSDGFVGAEGRFHILRTCNTWISWALREAGVPMGAWTPTPYAVRLSLWRFHHG